MYTQEDYCKNCGERLINNPDFCTNCGIKIKSNNIMHDDNTTEVRETTTKKSGSGKIKGVIVSILIFVISSFVGKFAGRFVGNELGKISLESEIDNYIQSIESYKPGVCTENSYISEFFNLQFNTNDNWFMYTEEELAPYSAQVKESAITSGVATLNDDDVSQDLVDKWIESVYAETEMGAYYVEDDMVVGEASIGVFSTYGVDETYSDEMSQAILEEFSAIDSNVKSGEQTIAGETFQSVEATITIDGMAMSSRIYIRFKDNMVCMISCKGLEGYESIFDSFFEQLSQYK